MLVVVRPRTIQQSAVAFPVKPAGVERTVDVANEASFHCAATATQRITNPSSVKSGPGIHHSRIMLCDGLMIHVGIEVRGDALLKLVERYIHEEAIAAGSYSREESRK